MIEAVIRSREMTMSIHGGSPRVLSEELESSETGQAAASEPAVKKMMLHVAGRNHRKGQKGDSAAVDKSKSGIIEAGSWHC